MLHKIFYQIFILSVIQNLVVLFCVTQNLVIPAGIINKVVYAVRLHKI